MGGKTSKLPPPSRFSPPSPPPSSSRNLPPTPAKQRAPRSTLLLLPSNTLPKTLFVQYNQTSLKGKLCRNIKNKN